MSKTELTEAEWKKKLTGKQFHVLRKKGTEPAFSGKYDNEKREGTYQCAGCGQELFDSKTKYDSRSGWPSFWAPLDEDKVGLEEDSSLFMKRIEVVCSNCGGHLGHVFDDGPEPTGQRYCINSLALDFEEQED